RRRRGSARNFHIVHQAQSDLRLSLQRRSWPPCGQGHQLPRPQRRNHPLDGIASWMAVAYDFPLAIHAVAADRDNFARNRKFRIWQRDSVKFQLQPAFTPEMARILGVHKMPRQIRAPREHRMAELLNATRMANHRVAHFGGGRREIWFIERALEKTSR